jgi:hypothetical protein
MQVSVTNSTEEDLELHISWPSCSANKQTNLMGTQTKKEKKRKNPRSEQKTQHNLIQSLQQKLASS